MKTIIALSSGHLPSGVAIIRLSGPKAASFLEKLVGDVPQPRKAALRNLVDADGSVLDSGLCILFRAPNSFTGEDVVELHVHGSKAVVARILDLACAEPDIRIAEPGEFARRAFGNGKIDLTEAEGLADLIEAETEAQRRVAQQLANGGLKALYNGWQDQLLNARALIEADIDFADEDDVPGSVADQIWSEMSELRDEVLRHRDSYDRSERLRTGFRVSLIGKPNVGKSSLLNALAGSDRAIVSDEAGTTRDVVEVRLDIAGFLVLLSDTAGIREGAGKVEAEGIRRSIETATSSDLVVLLSDDGKWLDLDAGHSVDALRVRTKSDIVGDCGDADINVSIKDSNSIEELVELLGTRIGQSLNTFDTASGIRSRYIAHIDKTADEIGLALKGSLPVELRAEHLRAAAHSLGRITGQYDTEDVLGLIFSSFCIGK